MENTKNAPVSVQHSDKPYGPYRGTYYIPVHVTHESVIPEIFLNYESIPTAEKEESEGEK